MTNKKWWLTEEREEDEAMKEIRKRRPQSKGSGIQTYFVGHAVDIHPHSSMPIIEYEVVLKLQCKM